MGSSATWTRYVDKFYGQDKLYSDMGRTHLLFSLDCTCSPTAASSVAALSMQRQDGDNQCDEDSSEHCSRRMSLLCCWDCSIKIIQLLVTPYKSNLITYLNYFVS